MYRYTTEAAVGAVFGDCEGVKQAIVSAGGAETVVNAFTLPLAMLAVVVGGGAAQVESSLLEPMKRKTGFEICFQIQLVLPVLGGVLVGRCNPECRRNRCHSSLPKLGRVGTFHHGILQSKYG